MGGTYGENFIRGSGQIENSGLIKVEQYYNDFSLGVDVVNDGVFDIRFTNSGITTSTFSLQAGCRGHLAKHRTLGGINLW